MTGMSRDTGRAVGFDAHLSQSIIDILTTPIGSRVLRRDYGSDLPQLIDAPMNAETMIDVYAATAEALAKWEPRLTLRRVEIAPEATGRLSLHLLAEVNGQTTAIQTGAIQ